MMDSISTQQIKILEIGGNTALFNFFTTYDLNYETI
jgi:hypothetical protein